MNEVSSQHSWGFSEGIRAAGQHTAFPLESDQGRQAPRAALSPFAQVSRPLALPGAWRVWQPCSPLPAEADGGRAAARRNEATSKLPMA